MFRVRLSITLEAWKIQVLEGTPYRNSTMLLVVYVSIVLTEKVKIHLHLPILIVLPIRCHYE